MRTHAECESYASDACLIVQITGEWKNMQRTPNLLAIQSHVVFGHAGNSAAVFPMQRVGVNVWPLNTVQFSNHTQYRQWTGMILPTEQLPALVQGIADIGELGACDAVLSGYLGSAAQGNAVLEVVAMVKAANPDAVYLCDPVMGHPEKGCIVPQEVSDFLVNRALTAADLVCPNQLELNSFCGRKPEDFKDCVMMTKGLLRFGPRAVMVKHMDYPGRAADSFEMILVTEQQIWHIRRPLLTFPRQPVGVGDLTSGLFLARHLCGDTLRQAFEFSASAVHAVLEETRRQGTYELQLVSAQEGIANPPVRFSAEMIPMPL